MKLIVCESYPGEISDGCPHYICQALEKGILGARAAVRKSLPSLPKDGEVVALRELADLMAKQWEDHAKGLVGVIDQTVRGEE